MILDSSTGVGKTWVEKTYTFFFFRNKFRYQGNYHVVNIETGAGVGDSYRRGFIFNSL